MSNRQDDLYEYEDERCKGAKNNLNRQKHYQPQIEINGIQSDNPWRPHCTVNAGQMGRCTALFDNLVNTLVSVIETYAQQGVVVGCIAWLSEPRVIAALQKHCRVLLLVVNDEDYEQWGRGSRNGPSLQDRYQMLPGPTGPLSELFGHMTTPLASLNTERYNAVRVAGGTDVLMHSKYLIFLGDGDGDIECMDDTIGTPQAVWTGSMNPTKRSSRNQENAMFIEDATIATAYFNDFANTFLISKPLGRSTTHTTY